MVATGNVALAFGLVIGSGVCGSIGAVLVFFVKTTNNKYLAFALGFAAGLMIYISLAEMLTQGSIHGFMDDGHSEDASIRFATLCFFAGCLLTFILDKILHFRTPRHKEGPLIAPTKSFATFAKILTSKTFRLKQSSGLVVDIEQNGSNDTIEQQPERAEEKMPQLKQPPPPPPLSNLDAVDLEKAAISEDVIGFAFSSGLSQPCQPSVSAEDEASRRKQAKLGRMAFLIACSMAIHNLFEGLAVFVGALQEPKFGAAVAFAIALHNLPESICIAFPIYFHTNSRTKAVIWTVIPSLFEPLGGLIAYLCISGTPSHLLFGITFGIISGIMVYISVQELLPTAFKYDPENKVVTISVLAGIGLMAVSLILLTL